jgi:polar amino acid transport system substrate-binding protein
MSLHKTRYIVRLFICTIVICLGLIACTKFENRVVQKRDSSVYERVMQSGKLRCAYVIYPPSCMKDPNTGELSGISIDAINLIAKKLGIVVDWSEEVGWGTMLEGLQTDRYDMVATAVWTNVSRAKVAAFSKALFYTPLYACVKNGDHRFDNGLDKANSPNIRIATIDGGIGQIVADEDFPQAHVLSMPQMTDLSQNLLNVTNNKADITFADPFTLFRYSKNNPHTIQNVSIKKPLRVFPDCWMFKRSEFEFKAMLDTVLDEVINSGAMDKIINKYEQTPGEIYRVALPYR